MSETNTIIQSFRPPATLSLVNSVIALHCMLCFLSVMYAFTQTKLNTEKVLKRYSYTIMMQHSSSHLWMLSLTLYQSMMHMSHHGISIAKRNLHGGFNTRRYTSVHGFYFFQLFLMVGKGLILLLIWAETVKEPLGWGMFHALNLNPGMWIFSAWAFNHEVSVLSHRKTRNKFWAHFLGSVTISLKH